MAAVQHRATTRTSNTDNSTTKTKSKATSARKSPATKRKRVSAETARAAAALKGLAVEAPAPSIEANEPGQFGRINVMDITPAEERGIFPARVELGEPFEMTAQVFIEGRTKAGVTADEVDVAFAGDLLDQCIGSSFALRDSGMPFVGLYGACSTMALSLAAAAVCVDARIADIAVASTSSHFCSAEKQFRMPLEYGGQRTPTAQWTATAAGAAVISRADSKAKIDKVIIGRICDYGVKDANNMGAAMAPAAAATIADFLNDTATKPEDYDMILTGDLGAIGSELLCELMIKQSNIDIGAVHADCGLMIYDPRRQKDTEAGASGCGCSASVVCSEILNKISGGELKRVLFVGTGALMSSVSSLQS